MDSCVVEFNEKEHKKYFKKYLELGPRIIALGDTGTTKTLLEYWHQNIGVQTLAMITQFGGDINELQKIR